MSKGSARRPTDQKSFDRNYDQIFGQKQEKEKTNDEPTTERAEGNDGKQE